VVVLEEVDGGADIGRDHAIVSAHAIHLHGEKDGYAELAEIPRSGDCGGRSPALPIENHTGGCTLACVEPAIAIQVERAPD